MHTITRPLATHLFTMFIASILPALSFAQQDNLLFKLNVLSNSSISIKGSSNINKFNCTACSSFKQPALFGTTGKGSTINLKGSILVPIKNFDCKNRALNRDLMRTLKADEFPSMTIHFIDIERMPNAKSTIDRLKGRVEIELAGKRRPFMIDYIINRNEGSIRLDGSRTFTFSDFDLAPPKKLAGIIKVDDNFNVNFSLFLEKEL